MSNMFQNATGVVDNAGKQLHSTAGKVGNTLQVTTDRILPPQQRKEIAQKLRDFAQENPKLASFLAAQAVLAGLPLVLFLAFATTTLLVSLTTCILLGLLAALAFTFFVVGFTLIFVVPTVFVASCSATFIFIWGFVGYTILRQLNGGEAPGKRGTPVGDTLRGLKEGRIRLAKKNGLAVKDGEHPHSKSVQANGEHMKETNGLDNQHDTIEWEQKWDSGVQLQPVVLEVENPYQALKSETEVS